MVKLGGETYSPKSGKIFRSDGTVANQGGSYDPQNRKVTVEESQGAISRGNLFSNRVKFDLAAGATAYIVYDVPDINIDVRNRIVQATDLGASGVNLDVNVRTGVTIDTLGAELDIYNANLNTDFLNNSAMTLYDETTTLLDKGNKIDPVSDTVIADKKDTKKDFIIVGYRLERNTVLAVEFTNNSSSNVSVEYKALWIESEVV